MLGLPLLPTVFVLGRKFLQQQGVTLHKTRINGIELSYYELRGHGKGAPMLLVHGLAGSSLSWGRCMVALASHSSRLVAFDIPGTGLSPMPAQGPLRYPQIVDLVEQFAKQMMPETFVFAGASMGAAMVTRVALRLEQRVKALALVVPAGARVPELKIPEQLARLTVRNKEDAKALVARLFAKRSKLREWVLADDAYYLYNQPWVQAIVTEATSDAGEMVLQETELAAIKIPTAIYWAKEERLLMEGGLEYFRSHLAPQYVEIEEIDDVGHSAHLEKPALIAARIAAFLSKNGC
jgi:pimeloyl-ACP methyl ester carboxylesterase